MARRNDSGRKTVSNADEWYQNLSGEVIGDYVLREYVGQGKIGYVYRASHNQIEGVDRAVKLIFDKLPDGWKVELQKVMKLALVPGVVHFHHLGTTHLTQEATTHLCQYTVWDYIAPGENLANYLKRNQQVSTSFLLAVVERVLHVLVACKDNGVARHGDLHPGNILIGNLSDSSLDESLQKRAPIYVSDFGYGATGAAKTPKDDFDGLRQIINKVIKHIDYSTANTTDRRVLESFRDIIGKLLREQTRSERQNALEILRVLRTLKHKAQTLGAGEVVEDGFPESIDHLRSENDVSSVGHFQVSEMLGERWDWWRNLFVPTVPARSKILSLDIPTVVTGPRGCGKTMLFRRLSERLIVECGPVEGLDTLQHYVALYVNANDYADAFAHFPDCPSLDQEGLLCCYANLTILGELLAVESARAGRFGRRASDQLLTYVGRLLSDDDHTTLLEGEDRLEHCRALLERAKWLFPNNVTREVLPGLDEMRQFRWLPAFMQQSRELCPWIGDRAILLFVDDFSTPRVNSSMQRVLNRLLLQRSSYYLSKLATEASSSFVSEESSGKNLQDGDDYQLVDIGEEALFLTDDERLAFLAAVFERRLALDRRIPETGRTLDGLLGTMPLSKTEFARRLREAPSTSSVEGGEPHLSGSQRRGRSRARVMYYGANVFSDLWSGDTRTMIQLITDVVGQTSSAGTFASTGDQSNLTIPSDIQDRVFRNRGGEWLESHSRNEPSSPATINSALTALRQQDADYRLAGQYGEHLKAVVEAFVAAARHQLLGPTYSIREGTSERHVPRMAFRIEVSDEFRIEGLAREIYRDLVRYGMFMRDSRGKSVRGTFVPRLYLRRLLLPYCALALSKRDSVSLSCDSFVQLLLRPDQFRREFIAKGRRVRVPEGQHSFPFVQEEVDLAYDDVPEAH